MVNDKLGNGKVGNGKLGSGNPGSFANSTVIPLFIWNVDLQLLYIKLSAVIYATLLNFQSPFRSRSASFSCCKDNAVRKLLMLTAVQSDVTHSASASTLERQSTLERERLLKSHAFNTER